MRVLMVAAENGALTGMKVGGIADVVRDVPNALHALGHTVDVLVPAYGLPGQLEQATLLGSVMVPFAGQLESVSLYQLTSTGDVTGVRQLLLQHPLFAAAGEGKIYCDDPPDRPFATDATKFALFSAAAVECLHRELIPLPDALHLHDWHTALVGVLITFSPEYGHLQSLHRVFTIHNLALQGTRPLRDDGSAFESWFPHIAYDGEQICDPSVRHCINPMRARINLSAKVHVVSPRYAEEILVPSDHQRGFFGGEGLEQDLAAAREQGRLVGILNGCEYPAQSADTATATMETFYAAANQTLLQSISRNTLVRSADYIAQRRLESWAHGSGPLLTSIGRLTDQKVLLLRQPFQSETVLVELLRRLAHHKARLIIMGTGSAAIEREFLRIAGSHENFIFLNVYGETLSTQLYSLGTLFLMPSSFEPCGISQMLAMRAGQPCIAHAVGGLANTITDGKTGFTFSGDNLQEQSTAFLATIDKALEMFSHQPKAWRAITQAAAKSRFDWGTSVKQYVQKLYKPK